MKTAFIFPGQGAQYVGMGKELYENFPTAREIFENANNILGYDIARICFSGPEEELVRTKYSQPAILVTSIACLSVLMQELQELKPHAAAGLSLGEYTALFCAGAIDFNSALLLVQHRADFMEEASKRCRGGMASVFGLSEGDVRKIIDNKVDIANLNCPGQVVISGDLDEINRLVPDFRKIVLLKVNGPFHSRFMEHAGIKLEPFVNKAEVNKPKIKFIANATGSAADEPSEIKRCLIKQVSSPVYWEKGIRQMLSMGIGTFIEIGPGRVLGGLLRRIEESAGYFNVEGLTSLKNTMEGLSYVTKG